MLTGLNHITLCVSDINVSFNFYKNVLGFKPYVKWDSGAYFTIGELWFCLNLGDITHKDNKTHIAFSVSKENFIRFQSNLLKTGIQSWQKNKSEGESFYFLDPDNHKLEVHVGNLETRLNYLKLNPPKNTEWYN